MILHYKFGLSIVTGAIALSLSTEIANAASFSESSFAGGDFSGERLSPTAIPEFGEGDNLLSFTIDNPSPLLADKSNRDLDYFSITIPKKYALTKLILTKYDPSLPSTGGPSDEIAFLALQKGNIFTEPPQPAIPPSTALPNPANLLGYTLIGSTDAANNFTSVEGPGSDLLPPMGLKSGRPNQPNGTPEPSPIGFNKPLRSGEYVFWAQQTAEGDANVELNFIVARSPEPSSILGLLALGTIVGSSIAKKIS